MERPPAMNRLRAVTAWVAATSVAMLRAAGLCRIAYRNAVGRASAGRLADARTVQTESAAGRSAGSLSIGDVQAA